MLRAVVEWDLCQACEPCAARPICPTRAIMKVDPGEPAWIEADRCSGCGECLAACLHGAIGWDLAGEPVSGRRAGAAGPGAFLPG